MFNPAPITVMVSTDPLSVSQAKVSKHANFNAPIFHQDTFLKPATDFLPAPPNTHFVALTC